MEEDGEKQAQKLKVPAYKENYILTHTATGLDLFRPHS